MDDQLRWPLTFSLLFLRWPLRYGQSDALLEALLVPPWLSASGTEWHFLFLRLFFSLLFSYFTALGQ